jgi:hypothetical protein
LGVGLLEELVEFEGVVAAEAMLLQRLVLNLLL